MTDDPTDGMTEEDARLVFLYPSGRARQACGSDNDGFPICMGDTGMCAYSRILDEGVCQYVWRPDGNES